MSTSMPSKELYEGANHEFIELVELARLKPNPKPVRVHPKKQLRLLKKSVAEDGICSPLIIDEDNNIIAGMARYQVAVELGLNAVPCRRRSAMSDRWKRQYPVTDNAIAEKAEWDFEVLAGKLSFELEFDCDIELMGFEQPEADAIIAEAAERKPEPTAAEDERPEKPADAQVVSKRGDLWMLGRHRLVCGDAADPDQIDRLMAGQRAAMVFIDPPYNQPIQGHVSGKGKIQHREFPEASGELTDEEFRSRLVEWFEQIEGHSENGAIVYVCMDRHHLRTVLEAGDRVFGEFKNLCVWVKSNAGMGTFYRSQHELVLVWKIGDGPHINNFGLGEGGRHRSNVWTYAGVNSFRAGRLEDLRLHPTVKPVALVADAIRDVSHRGQIVLDSFGGSGTTLIAAEKTGRRAFLVELDPGYCDVIVRRWQKLTGEMAVLDGTDVTFEDTEAQRLTANSGWGATA